MFIIGYAGYLVAKGESEAREAKLRSLEKARKAKSEKAELRRLENEIENEAGPAIDALETLSNQIIQNDASKKEN